MLNSDDQNLKPDELFKLKGEGEGPLPPVLQQYVSFKETLPGYLLLSQTGSFFEAFGEDAESLAQVANLALTQKSSKEFVTPMAGVPVHSLDAQIERLLNAGHKVAIAEQMGEADNGGVMERAITQLITPGTVTDEQLLGAEANYLASVTVHDNEYGLVLLDLSTGEFIGTVLTNATMVLAEVQRFTPRELLVTQSISQDEKLKQLQDFSLVSELTNTLDHANVQQLLESQLKRIPERLSHPALSLAAALVLTYAQEALQSKLPQIDRFQPYEVSDTMMLDTAALTSLEVFQAVNLRGDSNRVRTLFQALDLTRTAPGKRQLKSWLQHPLLDKAQIESRLDAVELFYNDRNLRNQTRTLLRQVQDLERTATRLSALKAGPRDLKSLEKTLKVLPDLQNAMVKHKAVYSWLNERKPLIETILSLTSAIDEDAPVKANQGGYIRNGIDEPLDRLREELADIQTWFETREQKERERTGIATLRFGENNALGIYIEVNKAQQNQVPQDYEHIQSLKDKVRFTKADIRQKYAAQQVTKEAAAARELELFQSLMTELAKHSDQLKLLSKMIARVDVYAGLAEVAATQGYVRPQLGSPDLELEGARHPIVERHVRFMRNDLKLSPDLSLIILTGPNMSGKSTYLRQTALISIMAQCGSFVPAQTARLPIFERVFTRIGANDDLAGGRSTFFVEAEELAYILQNANRRSLVLLDEVGRGTSTYDGLAVATAAAEYLHDELHAFTLFATHYAELTALAERLEHAENRHVAAEEQEGELVFYHQVLPGPASKSYGVEVAQLAGMPTKVVKRAKEVLASLQNSTIGN
ncbi:MAG: DNA mismatch repair protein MutS [Trueperaceae bacterium]|nr:DNA mismatch repair protein MutS [Trueperaceae bacterium]